MIARCDSEAFAVVGSSLSQFVDERHVDGVAVTCHPIVIVSAILVDPVDHHREFDGPLVFAVGRREIVRDLTTPALAEFGPDLVNPLDHRDDVREIVYLSISMNSGGVGCIYYCV